MAGRLADLTLACSDTYLSGRVRHIITEVGDIGNHGNPSPADRTQVLDPDGCLRWEYIARTLPDYTEDSFEYFVSCVERLVPFLQCIQAELGSLTAEKFSNKYSKFLQWTSLPERLEQCFEMTRCDPSLGPLLSVLQSSAILERSLGDVYLLRGRPPCPSMLKDLLLTPELLEMFGPAAIQLLRVLIGPPISLNLRNVTWHGFPGQGEIKPHYAYLFLCVTASLGKTLIAREVSMAAIPHREFITVTPLHDFPDLSPEDVILLQSVFQSSHLVHGSMISLWQLACQKYSKKCYGECLTILLPQIEHALRRVFAAVNHCENRILTAENSVFFTTFDEMLDQFVEPGKENQLRASLGDPFMSLLMDLLMYPEGPRIRDRLSHGEVNPEDVTVGLASQVLSVGAALCIQFIELSHILLQQPAIQSLVERVCAYQSQCHPLALLRDEVSQWLSSLEGWKSLPRPDPSDIETTVLWTHSQTGAQTDGLDKLPAYQCAETIQGGHLQDIAGCVLPFASTEPAQTVVRSLCLSTLYRHGTEKGDTGLKSREDELIGLLRKIAVTSLGVSQQVCAVASTRYSQYTGKELRSRQRNTYRRMLDSIPELSSGLRTVLFLVISNLVTIDNQASLASGVHQQNTKLMKYVLQYCENLLTYTHIDKNRWEEAGQLTHSLYGRVQSKES